MLGTDRVVVSINKEVEMKKFCTEDYIFVA